MPHRGRWLLISPPSDAPSPRRLASGFLLPRLPQQRPRDHGEHVLAKIGTAMLSYAEHGKFRAQTQGHRPFFPALSGAEKGERIKALASPFCGSVFRNVRQSRVDHDRGVSAMGRVLQVEKIATHQGSGAAPAGVTTHRI